MLLKPLIYIWRFDVLFCQNFCSKNQRWPQIYGSPECGSTFYSVKRLKTAFSTCVRSGLWIIFIFSPADGKIHIYICRKINKTLWKSFQIFMIFSTWSEWTEWKYWVLNCCQVKVMNKATVTKEPKIKWNYKMTGIISMVFKFKIFIDFYSFYSYGTFEIIDAFVWFVLCR